MEGFRKKFEKVARVAMVATSLTGAAEVSAPKPAEAAPMQSYEQTSESAETAGLMRMAIEVYSLLDVGKGEDQYSLDKIHMNLQSGSMKILGLAGIATGVQMGLRNILKSGTLSQKHSAIDRARQLIESSSLPEITKASLRQSFEQVSGQ